MKILLLIIAALFLLIMSIVAVGYLLPKRHVASRRASFRATPGKIFALITGPQTWRPEVTHTETVVDQSGRTLVRETVGRDTLAYETFDVVPDKSLKRRIVGDNLPFAGTWTFSLEPDGETTSVRITEDGEVYNPIFRFVSRLILGHTATLDTYLRNLGRALDQNPTISN